MPVDLGNLLVFGYVDRIFIRHVAWDCISTVQNPRVRYSLTCWVVVAHGVPGIVLVALAVRLKDGVNRARLNSTTNAGGVLPDKLREMQDFRAANI